MANAGRLVFVPAGTSTFAGAISGTGGVIKEGAGTTVFTGNNGYSGPTTIAGGQLTMTTSSTLGGGITVSPGATLGVAVTGSGERLAAQSLTLGTLSNLTIDLAGFGSGTVAPLSILGAVTTSGTATINFTTSSFSVGSIPLIRYGSLSSFSDLVLGQRPVGVQASLFNNTATNTVELVIQRTPRYWAGRVGGVPNGAWAVGAPTNWVFLSGTAVSATAFTNDDAVIFDDSAAGTTAVTLAGAVSPSSVTIDNSTKSYSFSGAGSISGSGGLVKVGSGTVTMSTINSYTGATTIGGGRFEVATLANGGVASPLGASSAAAGNLVLAGGTLAVTGGGSQATDRGFTVSGSGDTLELTQAGMTATFSGPVVASGPVRKTGAGTLALAGTSNALGSAASFAALAVDSGRLSLAGTGSAASSQVNTVTGEMWVGTAPGGAVLSLANSTLAVSSWLSLDSGTGSTLTNSALSVGNLRIGYDGGATPAPAADLSLTDSTLSSAGETIIGNSVGATGALALAGGSRLVSAGPLLLANGSSSVGSLVVAGSSTVTGSSYMAVGNFGSGTLTVRDAAAVTIAGDFNVADLARSAGRLVVEGGTVSGGAVFAGKNPESVGSVVIGGGALAATQYMTLGRDASSVGDVTLSAGSIASVGDITIGDAGAGTWTQTGGTASAGATVFLARGAAGSTGTVIVSGGLLAQTGSAGSIVVGEQGQGSLTVSAPGRVSVAGAGGLVISGGASGSGDVTLDGGTIEVTRVQRGAGTGTLNLNGGTIKAAANANTDFMSGLTSATILPGGVTIDTSGQNLAIGQSLLDYGGGDAAVTKSGAGVLTLTGTNTYGGLTTVAAGGLAIETSSQAAGGYALADGTVFGVRRVGDATSLAPAAGLTMSGSATLNFDFGSFGSQPAPLLGVAGGLFAGGNVIVNVSNASQLLGRFPLVSYGSKTGLGTYSLGTLTPGITGSIVVSTSNTIDLVVSAISGRFWNGEVAGAPNGAWTVGTTANWLIPPTTPTTFANGDEAVFTDSAAGTTAVTLAGPVSPSKTTIENVTKPYSFTGAGAISGTGALVKLGAGSVTMATANSYTGPTTIGGGRFEVPTLANGGVASPLGASSAAAGSLVLSGGTLAVTGSGAHVTDRSFTVGAAGGAVEVTLAGATATVSGSVTAAGTFRKAGAGTLAMSGSAVRSFAGLSVDDGRLSLVDAAASVAGGTGVGDAAGTTSTLAISGGSQLEAVGKWLVG
ncbi:MAG: beta strand repeat-containing protein, partial [Planctomycetaceae bacterium]